MWGQVSPGTKRKVIVLAPKATVLVFFQLNDGSLGLDAVAEVVGVPSVYVYSMLHLVAGAAELTTQGEVSTEEAEMLEPPSFFWVAVVTTFGSALELLFVP